MSQNEPTEVTIIEKTKSSKKPQTFVTETKDKPDVFKKLKDEADYLSAFTERVKKQMRAANNGPTRNAAPRAPLNLNPDRKPPGTREVQLPGDSPGPREQGDGGPAIRTVAIGPSSLAEYIPGVQEGAFTALNTDQFIYYTFFARLNEQVRNRWVELVRSYASRLSQTDLEKLGRGERRTIVEVTLNPNGAFHSSIVQYSSGDRNLDETSPEAFRRAAPFPNPPRGMIEADGLIHLRYAFVVNFGPPTGF